MTLVTEIKYAISGDTIPTSADERPLRKVRGLSFTVRGLGLAWRDRVSLVSFEVSLHESPSDNELSLCGASRGRVYWVLVLEMELDDLEAVGRKNREGPGWRRVCMMYCLERSI